MAVTGVFSADFGSFFDAVEKSEIKLKDLETGANKVGDNLSRMANSFSGQKIIQDATLMAKVFEEAGGASAFTEKELARMAATATEAAEKLEALGKDVPEGIKKIAAETKDATKETEGWTGSIKSLVLGFVSLQALKGAWNFVTDIAATAGALQDLSEQTHIGVEDLQIMSQAMADFGVDTEEMGRALFRLSTRIASGDDSVKNALLDLGLSFDAVRNKKGMELFLEIQNAAAKVNDSLRDTSLVTLYGEKLGQSMSGAAKGTQAAIDKTKEMNNIMSKDTVEALDSASEAIEKMTTSLKNIVGNAIGPVAEGFNTLVGAFNKGASSWEIFKAMAKDWMASNTITGASVTNLATLLDHLNQEQEQHAGKTRESTTANNANADSTDAQTRALERKRAAESAAGLKEFEQISEVAKRKQVIIDESVAAETKAANARAETAAKEIRDLEAKRSAGLGWMNAVKDFVGETKKAQDAEAAFNEEQEKLIASLTDTAAGHTEAGEAAVAAGQSTVAAYAGVTQQVELTSDGVRGYLELMRATNAANALLNQNSLFTTGSTLENQSRLGTAFSPIPGFARGVQNFAGGVAKVHGGETLVNLPRGTSVIPAGAGGPVVNNTFNLVDTESNLARRVSETIMRTVRAGTQLSTA